MVFEKNMRIKNYCVMEFCDSIEKRLATPRYVVAYFVAVQTRLYLVIATLLRLMPSIVEEARDAALSFYIVDRPYEPYSTPIHVMVSTLGFSVILPNAAESFMVLFCNASYSFVISRGHGRFRCRNGCST